MSEEMKVKWSHERAEQSAERPKYEAGMYFVNVTAVEKKQSKEKPEMPGITYKMIKLSLATLADPNDINSAFGPGLQYHQCLPFEGGDWDSLVDDSGKPTAALKKARQNVNGVFVDTTRQMLAGLLPEEVPAAPRKQEDGTYLFNGESIPQEQYKEKDIESRDAAGALAEQLQNEGPEALVDHGAYVLVNYKEGSDFPNIKAWSTTPLLDLDTGDELELVTSFGGEVVPVKKATVTPIKKPAPASKKPTAKKAAGRGR